jgi:hypothetical protein
VLLSEHPSCPRKYAMTFDTSRFNSQITEMTEQFCKLEECHQTIKTHPSIGFASIFLNTNEKDVILNDIKQKYYLSEHEKLTCLYAENRILKLAEEIYQDLLSCAPVFENQINNRIFVEIGRPNDCKPQVLIRLSGFSLSLCDNPRDTEEAAQNIATLLEQVSRLPSGNRIFEFTNIHSNILKAATPQDAFLLYMALYFPDFLNSKSAEKPPRFKMSEVIDTTALHDNLITAKGETQHAN